MLNDETALYVTPDTAQNYLKKSFPPMEETCDEHDYIPREIIDEMSNLGLFGLSVPEEREGFGTTLAEEMRVIFELCRTSPVFQSSPATSTDMIGMVLVYDYTEKRKKLLPQMARGKWGASFCLTGSAGSGFVSQRTTAVKDDHSYILNGTKRFLTNAPDASIFIIYARTNLAIKGAGGVSAFIVDAKTPGVTILKKKTPMESWGGYVLDVIFKDCQVSAEKLLHTEENDGYITAIKVLENERTHVAAAICAFNVDRTTYKS